jgi:hypothetical protein
MYPPASKLRVVMFKKKKKKKKIGVVIMDTLTAEEMTHKRPADLLPGSREVDHRN